MTDETSPRHHHLVTLALLGLCAGLSGCSWLSSILAGNRELAPVDAAPRARVIARAGDTDIVLAANQDRAKTSPVIALPPAAAEPSRFIAEPPAEAAARQLASAAQPPAPLPAVSAPPTEELPESALLRRLESWRRAWGGGRFESYARFYDGAYRGTSSSRAAWEAARKERLGAARISVRFEDVRTSHVAPDEIRVEFVQRYASARHHDVGLKQMTLRRGPDGGWVIVEETWQART